MRSCADGLKHVIAAVEADERMVAYHADLEGPLCAPDSVPCAGHASSGPFCGPSWSEKLARASASPSQWPPRTSAAAACPRWLRPMHSCSTSCTRALATVCGGRLRPGLPRPRPGVRAGFTVRVGAGQRSAAALEQRV